jgi:hypothetical protein
MWDSNPNKSFADIEKDSHESGFESESQKSKKDLSLTFSAKTIKKGHKITFCKKFEETRLKLYIFLVVNCQRKDMLKVTQIWTILINFGFFLPGNKDSNPWLWDSNLLALPQNSQKDSNL